MLQNELIPSATHYNEILTVCTVNRTKTHTVRPITTFSKIVPFWDNVEK